MRKQRRGSLQRGPAPKNEVPRLFEVKRAFMALPVVLVIVGGLVHFQLNDKTTTMVYCGAVIALSLIAGPIVPGCIRKYSDFWEKHGEFVKRRGELTDQLNQLREQDESDGAD